MKNLNKKLLILALIFSTLTTYLVFSYIKGANKVNSEPEYIKIVVASRDIMPREKITSNMIKEIKVLKESHIINSIQDKNKIIGMYTKERIMKGEVIPQERLFKEGEEYLSFRIPKDRRAVSIAVDEMKGVADLIKPGDYVDVYVTVTEKKIENKYNNVVYPEMTKLLLQNILVLAIGKEQFAKDEDRKEIPDRYSVTLAVSATDAEKLILGEEIGVLKLALRPLKDIKINDTPGAIRNDLVPEKGKVIIEK